MASTISKILKTLFGRPSNCRDFNIHIRLPLTFGPCDIKSTTKPTISTSIQDQDTRA